MNDVMIVIGLVWIMVFSGCHDPYSDGWSWSITAEDGERESLAFRWNKHEVRVDDVLLTGAGMEVLIPTDPHKLCKHKHYHDPYTKLEYCLPENFANVSQLHLYRVK